MHVAMIYKHIVPVKTGQYMVPVVTAAQHCKVLIKIASYIQAILGRGGLGKKIGLLKLIWLIEFIDSLDQFNELKHYTKMNWFILVNLYHFSESIHFYLFFTKMNQIFNHY